MSIPSIQKLTKEISALTMVVKSANMGGARLKTNDKSKLPTHKNGNENKGVQASSPRKSKGPATSAAGPFKPGQEPFQCYKCGGWGHGFRECPTLGGPRLEGLKWGCATSCKGERPETGKPSINDWGVIKRGEEKYYNHKWGCATSCKGERPETGKPSINDGGVIKKGAGEIL